MINRDKRGRFARRKKDEGIPLIGKLLLGGTLVTTLFVILGTEYNERVEVNKIVYAAEVAPEAEEIIVEVKIDWTKERIIEEIKETFPENPNTMTAVAKCESGLNPEAVGPTSDFGLLQIHAPTWDKVARELGLNNYQTDIEQNLKMARHVYDVQGIRAWVCYSHGYYKKYL